MAIVITVHLMKENLIDNRFSKLFVLCFVDIFGQAVAIDIARFSMGLTFVTMFCIWEYREYNFRFSYKNSET